MKETIAKRSFVPVAAGRADGKQGEQCFARCAAEWATFDNSSIRECARDG